MVTKKNSTPRATSRKTSIKSRDELRREVAESIAALLTNPETPTALYNALVDTLCDLESALLQAESTTPEFIARALSHYQEAEAKRAGRAR